jgi:hypothetical protein
MCLFFSFDIYIKEITYEKIRIAADYKGGDKESI